MICDNGWAIFIGHISYNGPLAAAAAAAARMVRARQGKAWRGTA